jgi:hypothetical protein
MIFRGKQLPPRMPDWRARAAAAFAVLIMTAGIVHADVRVSGDAKAVQLDATQSTVAEALSALESAFPLRVNTSAALDGAISGIYTGALPAILSRLLQGYNYVIRRQASEIEVTVIGAQGNRAAAVERPRQPPSNPALSLADAVRRKIH